jgi:uncharacterized protein (TIGR03437 family)
LNTARIWRLFGLAFLLSYAVRLSAQTPTYTYTGNDFTNAVAPYTTTEFVTGYFTTSAPLAANLNAADISSEVQFFSFSVGQSTWNSMNAAPSGQRVSTDGQGHITAWLFGLYGSSGPVDGIVMITCNGIPVAVGGCADKYDVVAYHNSQSDLGLVSNDPGTWSISGVGATPGGQGGIITTVAGSGPIGYYFGSFSGDGGLATAATLNQPSGVAVDVSGNLYIADTFNFRVRKVSPSGIITTIAGGGNPPDGVGDGGLATSASLEPSGIAFDASGNLYIADGTNNRIRKVSNSGIITTVAGNGFTPGDYGLTGAFSGDGGPATSAELSGPAGVAVDTSGNLFIADSNNNRIRKVSPSGIITTVAGSGAIGFNNGSFSGDGGPATSATLWNPNSVVVDAVGNLFIGDSTNDRIRKVSPSGIISTVVAVFPGDNGVLTQLYNPAGVTVDALGNLLIADTTGNRVLQASASGVVTNVAGSGTPGDGAFAGDGGQANLALLNQPNSVALDSSGNLFIADTDNNRIREVFAPLNDISTLLSVTSVGNGASFTQAFAPGMLTSVFGTGLSTGSPQMVTTAPLPLTSLSGTSITINGIPAPLLYISATQINLQIPYDISPGTAALTVNAGGQSASISFSIQAAGPGIFVDSQTGHIVPNESATAGSTIGLYLTGAGQVTPSEATGNVPDKGTTPVPNLPLTMTVGGVAVTPVYVGIPDWSVGVLQINFTVPSTLAAGTYPVIVTIGGVASQSTLLTVTSP